MKDIGHIIENTRKTKKITQEALALRVEISRSYLTNIENGRRMPALNVLKRLIGELDLEINTLF